MSHRPAVALLVGFAAASVLMQACAKEASHRMTPQNIAATKLAGDFKFTEGPVWLAGEKVLLFSDIPANKIIRFESGKTAVFRDPSGNSNGLTLDKQGRLIACEHGNRRVSRTEKDGSITVLADKYEGKRLNSPNDVVVKKDGAIYFTDPPYGVKDKERELGFQGVYRISPDGKELTLLVKDFIKPNGLALSPDEKTLYIADTEGGHIRAFDVKSDGTIGNGREWTKIEWPDGMKVDVAGNVYCTGSPGVVIFDPSGQQIGVVTAPEMPANCAFGGPDWKTLFMTCRTGLYSAEVSTSGIPVP